MICLPGCMIQATKPQFSSEKLHTQAASLLLLKKNLLLALVVRYVPPFISLCIRKEQSWVPRYGRLVRSTKEQRREMKTTGRLAGSLKPFGKNKKTLWVVVPDCSFVCLLLRKGKENTSTCLFKNRETMHGIMEASWSSSEFRIKALVTSVILTANYGVKQSQFTKPTSESLR